MKQVGYITGVLIVLVCCSYEISKESNSSAQISSLANHPLGISLDDTIHNADGNLISRIEGAATFSTQCQQCHTTVVSHDKDSTGWQAVIPRMSINAGLDSIQEQDLTIYILWKLEQTDSMLIVPTIGRSQW
ncbi:MAG: hypothetical protein ACI837_001631 [Crocinitomicaceae bacterium]|jgi:hypothetical protein